jgi:succinyl-diaminopimelate desuccinylase
MSGDKMDNKLNNKLINLTEELVRFRSDKGNPDEIDKTLSFIRKYILDDSGSDSIEFKEFIDNDVKTLYVFNNEAVGPEILLCGHIDVISADVKDFKPRHDDKYIYGRGSGDMKSGVAAIIELFLKYCQTKNVRLLISTDEEIGGFNGVGYVYDKINPSLVLVTEPTSNNIRIKEKGGLWIDINVTGPGGHASKPWVANNCIDILIGILSELRIEYTNPKSDEWKTTMNIGAINGGKLEYSKGKIISGPANSIADNASVRLDFRLVETTSHDDIISDVNNIISKKMQSLNSDFKIDTVIIEKVVHLNTDENNPYVKKLVKLQKELFNEIKISPGHAASDGRFFSSKGIPVILYGPESLGHHSNNERVELISVINTYNLLDKFMEDI